MKNLYDKIRSALTAAPESVRKQMVGGLKNLSRFDLSWAGRRANSSTAEGRAIISQVVNIAEAVDAPNYMFIVDRSPSGQELLHRFKIGPAELRIHIANSVEFQRWEVSSAEFVVIWGEWGVMGGMVVGANDLNTLLEDALPNVMARNAKTGGTCGFIPGVNKKILPPLMSRLKALQPATQSNKRNKK